MDSLWVKAFCTFTTVDAFVLLPDTTIDPSVLLYTVIPFVVRVGIHAGLKKFVTLVARPYKQSLKMIGTFFSAQTSKFWTKTPLPFTLFLKSSPLFALRRSCGYMYLATGIAFSETLNPILTKKSDLSRRIFVMVKLVNAPEFANSCQASS